jgi:hypothetical protein
MLSPSQVLFLFALIIIAGLCRYCTSRFHSPVINSDVINQAEPETANLKALLGLGANLLCLALLF